MTGRSFFLAAAFVALSGLAVAGDGELRVVQPPSGRPGKKILLLVDVSGSMHGPPLGRALKLIRQIAGQPIDQGSLAVVSFAEDAHRWQHKGRPWVKLPDAEAVKAAHDWIAAKKGDGATRVIAGLNRALSDREKELSVVLISDGVFMEHDQAVLKALLEGQAWRKAQLGVPPVKLGTICVAKIEPSHVMSRLGKAGGLGAYYLDE